MSTLQGFLLGFLIGSVVTPIFCLGLATMIAAARKDGAK